MININSQQELYAYVGKEIGISDWLTIDQRMINAFADATGDHQWIHVDMQKASSVPYKSTIAHGFLLLSLLPGLKKDMVHFGFAKMAINYGSDKVRFLTPVPAGSRIRLRVALNKIEEGPSGIKLFTRNNLELEGQGRDALAAETITLLV